MNQQSPKLLEQVSNVLRYQHYVRRTEKTYLHWIERYIFFHNTRHPAEIRTPEVEAFLIHLAVEKKSPPPPETLLPLPTPRQTGNGNDFMINPIDHPPRNSDLLQVVIRFCS